MERPKTGCTTSIERKGSLELRLKRRESLIMADGEGKVIPGDRAHVRKSVLSLELLASVRNSESSSICRDRNVIEGMYNCNKSETYGGAEPEMTL